MPTPVGWNLFGLWCICLLWSAVGCENRSPDAKSEIAKEKPVTPKSIEPNRGNRFSTTIVENGLPDSAVRNGSEHGQFLFPESIGGGLAIADIDSDGRPDVITSGGGYPDMEAKQLRGYVGHLFRAISAFEFVDQTLPSRLDMSQGYSHGVSAADYNNDGFVDLLITGFNYAILFQNQGDGTFEDVTGSSGLHCGRWGTSSALFDADGDGDLDVYVADYGNWSFENNPPCYSNHQPSKRDYCGPRMFLGLVDTVFQNKGDGTFVDMTETAKFADSYRGLGVIAADLDGDSDTDIYVANDVDANLLYRNEGNWKFTEMGVRGGGAYDNSGRSEGSMGIALGDYNQDSKFDLWVTNYQNELCALYRNDGNLSFTYASSIAKISATDEQSVSWGTAFTDFELDGDEDLLVINGHLESYAPNSPFEQKPQLLENVDGKFFRLERNGVGKFFDTPESARGLAMGDFDKDGLVDFAVSILNKPCEIVRNTSKPLGKFLEFQLVGTQSNRDAIGAVVTITVGNRSWVRQIYGGGSYASASERLIHVGVPDSLAAGNKATVAVKWNGGKSETREGLEWNRCHILIEGQQE